MKLDWCTSGVYRHRAGGMCALFKEAGPVVGDGKYTLFERKTCVQPRAWTDEELRADGDCHLHTSNNLAAPTARRTSPQQWRTAPSDALCALRKPDGHCYGCEANRYEA